MFEPQRLPMRAEEFEIARRRMLAEISARAVQLRETTGRAAFDERVMAAMGRVPRHEFVPIEFQRLAYANIPLPIGFDKTISQPYVVAPKGKKPLRWNIRPPKASAPHCQFTCLNLSGPKGALQPDVRFWHKADIQLSFSNVCFWG